MKILFFTVLLSSLFLLGGLIESSKWVPTNGGNKGALPDFAMVDSPSGKAAQVTVVEKNPYQGMHFYLNEPIDLNGIKSVSFRVKQNASEKYPVNACLQLHYNEKRSQGFYVSFSIKVPDANGWSDVTIPLESAKKYPLQRNGEISIGLAISGTFSLYAALQEPGQSLAISNLQFNPKEEAVKKEAVSILGTNLVESAKWASMNGGHVGANPDLKIIDSPYGKSVQITVVEKNPYQSVDFFLKEPIDLNGIGSVTFRMKQNARTAFPSKGCLQLQYDAQHKSGLYIPFVIPKPGTDGWSRVNVPIDVRTARSLQRTVAAYLSNAVCGNISLYSYLQDVGQYMSIADLRFNPMLNKVGKIPVANYVYRSTRTSGDSKGNILTDGNVEEKDQVYYQQYAEDADIIFDLGAFYLVKKIDVASFAIPGQNFFEYHVYVSNDGDEWKPGAIVTTKDDGGTKKAYSVSGENLSLLGDITLNIGQSTELCR